ncbi:MAG: hypothetical protein AAGB18_01405 [Pseudomonadota bacterium]
MLEIQKSALWFVPLVAVACFCTAPLRATELRICTVADVSGGAAFLVTAAGQTVAAEVGAPLGDIAGFETDPAARLEIRCEDGLVITLGPGTQMDAEGLLGPTDESAGVLLRLWRGITGLVAPNPTWSSLGVETELAIASVRSTEWLVEHEESVGSAVFVALGEVGVTIGDTAQVLSAGQGINAPPDGTPQDIVSWSEERIARSRAALGLGWASSDGQ